MSIDFSAAHYPLIWNAYELLRRLERANPLKPEAGILRQRLYTGTTPVTASVANQPGRKH